MFWNKINRGLILFLVTLLLTGCADQGISLEAALSEAGKDAATGQLPQTETASKPAEEAEALALYVYVCGEVQKPGVYMLEAGSRIAAAIEAAGGFTQEASKESVNLAKPVEDGMQITIPNEQDVSQEKVQQEKAALGLVNLNTATLQELCSLSGIGEAKAEAILAYRAEIGSFQSVEQLKEVTGIGESLFNKIKSNVYIE